MSFNINLFRYIQNKVQKNKISDDAIKLTTAQISYQITDRMNCIPVYVVSASNFGHLAQLNNKLPDQLKFVLFNTKIFQNRGDRSPELKGKMKMKRY